MFFMDYVQETAHIFEKTNSKESKRQNGSEQELETKL